MVNEVIHAMKMHEVDGIILKLDFLKAYDTVDWTCLLHIINCINLDAKWSSWIRSILESTRISILVNGSPTKKFSLKRGIRQGDPLVPYMFLLIGEVLCKLLNLAQVKGMIAGVKFPFHSKSITHFQYADDTILFIENDVHSVCNMKIILLLFQVISGLAINFNKSQVYHVTNDRNKVDKAMEIMGCNFGMLLFKYLGAWIGLEKKSKAVWEPLKEKLCSKLKDWKCNYLNLAGISTLLKTCLDGIPNYWLSLH